MCATPTVVIVTVSHWQGGEGDEGHAAVTFAFAQLVPSKYCHPDALIASSAFADTLALLTMCAAVPLYEGPINHAWVV